MKWSELSYSDEDFYIPYDENQRAVRGFLLTTLGVDLEHLPRILFQPYLLFNRTEFSEEYAQKVYVSDIIGTSYSDYGGISIIESFIRIKRACHYIQDGCVTRGKYFHMLKKPVNDQPVPIRLSRLDDGRYYVDGNGNHRVVLYKIMMLAEIASTYEWARSDDYDLNYIGFEDITKKYWLNALVKKVPKAGREYE